MKNGKVPSKKQKIAIQEAGLNPDNWLIFKKNHEMIRIIHRETGRTKRIPL